MDRHARPYVFPGGVLEVWDYHDEDEPFGMDLEVQGSEPPATDDAETDGPAA